MGGEQSEMDERFRRIEEEEEGSSLGMMSSMSHKTSRLVTCSGGKALFGGTEKEDRLQNSSVIIVTVCYKRRGDGNFPSLD